jgi:regulatory protein YycI of two-component signal transduction system YycFG
MDFKKITLIFFIVFLGLNAFLFSIYYERVNEQKVLSRSNQTEDIAKRLKSDDITYDGKISDEHEQGYYLSGEITNMSTALANTRIEQKNTALLKNSTEVDNETLTSYPVKTYSVDRNNIRTSLSKFLTDKTAVLYGKDYSYNANLSTTGKDSSTLVATQQYDGIPFNDETSKLTVDILTTNSKSRINKYSQTHLDNIEPLREKMVLYSEKEILGMLFTNNRIPSDSKITKAFLAYTRTVEVRGKNVYVPVWFVTIKTNEKNSQVEKVNAISNTVITNNLVPKVENQ